MDWNSRLFLKINSLVGRNRWLDAIGRAGAEWAIVAMLGWFGASVVLATGQVVATATALPFMLLAASWLIGWLFDVTIGLWIHEPRPYLAYPEANVLFKPFMKWKSFPSDHAMSAWLIVATALWLELPGVEGLVVLALWVCFGRVYAGVHYPFDVLCGSIIGVLVSAFALYSYSALRIVL